MKQLVTIWWLVLVFASALLAPLAGRALPVRPLPPTSQLAAGGSHSLLLRPNGTVSAWGENNYGQLGNGSVANSPTPVAVALPGSKRFAQVAAGLYFSLALATDGSVYAWGYNADGQLGNGNNTASNVPVAVSLPAGVRVVQVAAGQYHALALAADGTLYAWGYNNDGQLGIGTTNNSNVPVATATGVGKRFTQLAAGQYHTLALAADGTLYAWGYNAEGELGNGTVNLSLSPVATSMPTGVRFSQVAAGASHSLAVATTGTLYTWGNNAAGQLGNNSTTQSTTPVLVSLPGSRPCVQLAAGQLHTLALAADGTAYAWGSNAAGQLGTGTANPTLTPAAVALPTGVLVGQLAAGYGYSLALAADGSVDAWGDNYFGQLGTGTTGGTSSAPVATTAATPTGYVSLGGGYQHSLTVRADGAVYTWGINNYGQLGTGSATTQSLMPVAAATPAGQHYRQAAAGGFHDLALAADGTAYAWGENNYGQLGNSSTTNSNTPVAVTMPVGKRFVQVSGGQYYSLALAADGTVFAWGQNLYGQLGDGTTTDSNKPVTVGLPASAHIVQVAAGDSHALALAGDGTVYAWGYNADGEMGNGTTAPAASPVTTPVAATMPSGVLFVQVAAGRYHALAVAADGTLYAWGQNDDGELGTGNSASSSTPVAVSLPTGVLFNQVAGGAYSSLAIAATGKLYAWGYNHYGELGLNSYSGTSVPTPEYSGQSYWRGVASGPIAYHSLVLGANAAIFTAGYNSNGQLGDGTTTNSPVFTRNLAAAPLPVQLTTFTARRATPTAVALTWATASETNCAGFGIEKSSDGAHWQRLGLVAGAGTSLTPHPYAYTDTEAPGAAYYRLAQTDFDGTVTYSLVQYVSGTAPSLSLYPNPAGERATTLHGATPGTPVQVLDALGRTVLTTTTDAAGTAPLVLPTSLPAGVYLVRSSTQAVRLSVP